MQKIQWTNGCYTFLLIIMTIIIASFEKNGNKVIILECLLEISKYYEWPHVIFLFVLISMIVRMKYASIYWKKLSFEMVWPWIYYWSQELQWRITLSSEYDNSTCTYELIIFLMQEKLSIVTFNYGVLWWIAEQHQSK